MEFRYVAYAVNEGIVKGRIGARDESEARAIVAHRGLRPLKVSRARQAPALEDLFPSLFSVNTGELTRFCRQTATMLGSGGNLLRTLDMLQAETHNRMMRRTLSQMRATLDDGGSLSSAMAQHPKVFSQLFVSVVEVGEYTGRLAPALEQMADILEKEREAKQKAMRTMMYPMAIILLSVITLGILMTVALPPLLKTFEQMGSSVPVMTRVAVALMAGLKANFLKMLLGAALLGGLVYGLRRIGKIQLWMDGMQARTPVVGALVVSGELSRFSRTVAMLLESGVPLDTAVRLGKGGCKNRALRQAFGEAEDSLLSGHGLTDTLKLHTVVPRMFVQLVLIGEESNSLQRTMTDAANAYQQQMENRLNSLLSLLEPASTLAVGGIVAFIAFSMFVPIYKGLDALK